MPLGISPPTTDIEIISQACALCGKSSFNTVAGGGAFATDAERFYNTLVSAELGSTRWRFAMTHLPMAVMTTIHPQFEGFNYCWEMPADLLMLHRIDPPQYYTVMGRRVLMNSNHKAIAVYSRNVPVTYWPPAFSMYIIYALACQLAASITNSDRMVARLQADKKMWESRALYADGQNSYPRIMRSRPWVNIRWAFYNGRNGS